MKERIGDGSSRRFERELSKRDFHGLARTVRTIHSLFEASSIVPKKNTEDRLVYRLERTWDDQLKSSVAICMIHDIKGSSWRVRITKENYKGLEVVDLLNLRVEQGFFDNVFSSEPDSQEQEDLMSCFIKLKYKKRPYGSRRFLAKSKQTNGALIAAMPLLHDAVQVIKRS